MLHVDVKDSLQQPCLDDSVQPGLSVLGLALGYCLGILLLRHVPPRHQQQPQLGVRG
jgi:hypothetical protein